MAMTIANKYATGFLMWEKMAVLCKLLFYKANLFEFLSCFKTTKYDFHEVFRK